MIGTHNSMTYLPPKKWYMYPFRFVAKCQSKSIPEQYEDYNVRLFDIRIGLDKKGNLEFRHGSMTYKGSVDEVFNYLNTRPEPVYVRLIFESKSKAVDEALLFAAECESLEDNYQNIKFFAGNRKCDWKVVYHFKNPDLPVVQMVSSMTWKVWDDWWPWLYARFKNKENRIKYKDTEYLLLDFIEI